MHEEKAKLNNPNLRFFAEDINERAIKRYYLLTDEAFKTLLHFNKINNLKNCFYEIMPSSTCTYSGCGKEACNQMLQHFGTRLYLDVEFPSNADFSDFRISQMEPLTIGKEIAVDITAFLEKRFDCNCELIVLKSHRPGKYSWHMIAKIMKNDTEHIFKDSLSVFTIINEWFDTCDLEKYNYYKDDHEECAVDISVYATHKLYRTIHSTKYNKSTPLEFATYFPIKVDCCISPEVSDTLCLQPLKGKVVLKVESTESSTKLKNHVSASKKRKSTGKSLVSRKKHATTAFNLAAEMFFSNWSYWTEMKRFIQTEWPKVEFEKASFKSIFTIYIPLDYDFRCPQKRGSQPGGCHKSNHSCLWVKPQVGLIEWRCHDLECTKRKICKKVHFPFQLSNTLKRMYTHRFPVQI